MILASSVKKRGKLPNPTRLGASEREAATHFGVSTTSIQAWKRKGWAVCYQDGSIDLDSTAAKVNANRDGRGGKSDRATDPHDTYPPSSGPADTNEPPDPPDAGELTEVDPETAKINFGEARRRREIVKLAREELALRKERSELVAVDDAVRVYAGTIVTAKTNLEAVPARVAPRLVGITNQVEIRRVVAEEIARALRSLSDEPPAVG